MKIVVSINVWEEFNDMQILSEIVKMENNKKKVFDEILIIANSGSKNLPSTQEKKYLNKYNQIDNSKIKNYKLVHKFGEKYMAHFRILENYKNIYDYAIQNNCDYIISTNADAWILDLIKLKTLLKSKKIYNSAVSIRLGRITGTDISYGDFVPFYDDHYVIINVKKSKHIEVFERNNDKFYDPIFVKYGGFHYQFQNYWEGKIPKEFFTAYTYMEDSLNHYGEFSGQSPIPFQYQPSFGFMHANCHLFNDLHYLRAKILKNLNFDSYYFCKKYCYKYSKSPRKFYYKKNNLFFKEKLIRKFIIKIYKILFKCKSIISIVRKDKKVAYIKKNNSISGSNCIDIFKKQSKVNHYIHASRL